MNIFKQKENTPNTISHVLMNKHKGKFPEAIVSIRQLEERDINEVRQLLYDHFNSLTLPAVIYWSIQHIYDLLVIIVINYIFFLDLKKIFYFLIIFLIYLYIRAKLEFLNHIRKDCPDLENLYKSYINVEGCNFWVAEVYDNNFGSASRTTCSDIHEREKIILEQEEQEKLLSNNNKGNNNNTLDEKGGEMDQKLFKHNLENNEYNNETQNKVLDHVKENKEININNNKEDNKKYNKKDNEKDNKKDNKKDNNNKDNNNNKENNNNNKDNNNNKNKDNKKEITSNFTSDNNNSNYNNLYYKSNDQINNNSENQKDNVKENLKDPSSTQNVGEEKNNNDTCNEQNKDNNNNNNNNNNQLSKFNIFKNKKSSNDDKDNNENCSNEKKNKLLFNISEISNRHFMETKRNVSSGFNEIRRNIFNCKVQDEEDLNKNVLNKKIVGCVGIVPFKGDNTIAQLVRMVVKKDNRRMRIGSRLLTQLENFAHEQNYNELKVFTNNLNTDSLYFVKQNGFNLSQIVRRGLMRGDLLIWSKILNKDDFYKFNSSEIQSYTNNILD
ncbi:N-acetyltransferase, putative [Plasmodium reichenowi]|uniref:N-acetyltransferase, putative n=1 Tax=Plasmodium reichenowi TaxID=5854 RepID=A0A151L506_PLARE|nr:N-acetyltransferase, putative [Plasmodium reichenowi]KYN94023.1 N-acetyltransferase, putative [Plasmodium reichenowi]